MPDLSDQTYEIVRIVAAAFAAASVAVIGATYMADILKLFRDTIESFIQGLRR